MDTKPTPVDLFFTTYEPPTNAAKPPIIFIHGVLSSPYCWNNTKNRISDTTGRKVYAICLRNHGTSGWSDEFSVDHIAADLKNFMLKEKIPKAILIAHSLGGRVAIKFAMENPHLVEKLIAEDATFTVDKEQIQVGQEFRSVLKLAKNAVEQFPPSLSEAAAQKRLQQLFAFVWGKKPGGKSKSRPPTFTLPFHKDKSDKFVWDFNVDAIIKSLTNADNFQTNFSENSVCLAQAMFTSGEYSKIPVVKDKELILKHFPNSKIICAEGVYHNYHLEKPDEFVKEVTKFIGV
ncbi:Protein ABHD11 [Araneus ventricosus]|uniref:sn-1-specific diacylglycerol lipase ABHD11 n=1 Tax=Araneus ventricosus TaxID=182803 RepID=A0A4Y2AKD6_ARAVE|nr:Protein ABHD11 [Araneus ventricosus]